ncbi:MAG: hypothetical protein JW746_06970 [Candidatus Krumholzibacteriota bacterium]|nr:hypothetical protein [Candidatus Krumholzibacteriota bacterium]
MKNNITVIGAIHISWGLLGMFNAMVLHIILGSAGMITGDYEVQRILGLIASSISIPLFALGIPAIAGGIGILKTRSWARILLLAYSFVNLLFIPFGTVLGIFTIKFLLDKETVELFAGSKAASTGSKYESPMTGSGSGLTAEEDEDIL